MSESGGPDTDVIESKPCAPRALVDVDYVVARLGVPKPTVYSLVRRKLIPVVRIGRQMRFDAERLEAFIAAGGAAIPGDSGWKYEEQ